MRGAKHISNQNCWRHFEKGARCCSRTRARTYSDQLLGQINCSHILGSTIRTDQLLGSYGSLLHTFTTPTTGKAGQKGTGRLKRPARQLDLGSQGGRRNAAHHGHISPCRPPRQQTEHITTRPHFPIYTAWCVPLQGQGQQARSTCRQVVPALEVVLTPLVGTSRRYWTRWLTAESLRGSVLE